MTRYHATASGNVPFTAEEEAAQDIADAASASNYLAEMKAIKWEEIKRYRTFRLEGGFFTNGHWYHSDLASKTEYNTMKLKALEHKMESGNMADLIVIDGSNTQVKTMDNGYMNISHNDILSIVAAGEIQTKRTYTAAATHQYFLNLSSDPANYDYKTAIGGVPASAWPTIYGE